MRIVEARITTGDLGEALRFFVDVLLLPADRRGSMLEVRVGRSRLVLTEDRSRGSEVHHLAFDVPASAFAAHRDWLAARVPLLAGADGGTEFEGPPGWNSRSVYFEGPDRMVLELIARRNRAGAAAPEAPQLLSISEVGVAVVDVQAALAELHRVYGLLPFRGTTADFAPVGDEEGLLIVVAEGRGWFPVQDVAATPLPLSVEVDGVRPGGATDLNPLATLRSAGA